MNGGASFPFMDETAQALSQAIPHAKRNTLAGQTHDVAPEASRACPGGFLSRPELDGSQISSGLFLRYKTSSGMQRDEAMKPLEIQQCRNAQEARFDSPDR